MWGGGTEYEKTALLIDGFDSINYDGLNTVSHVIIQITPFEKKDNESIYSENKISAAESDYDIMMYIVDTTDNIRLEYIAPTKEIVNKKIYLNNNTYGIFFLALNFSSITGVQYLDFSLVKNIDNFIRSDYSTVNIVGDLYFNFRETERIALLLSSCSLSGNVKVILTNTIMNLDVYPIFADMHVSGKIFIVDASDEVILDVFGSCEGGILNKCTGAGIFIDYTAGHDSAAYELVRLIGGYNDQYNGGVFLGEEVTI